MPRPVTFQRRPNSRQNSVPDLPALGRLCPGGGWRSEVVVNRPVLLPPRPALGPAVLDVGHGRRGGQHITRRAGRHLSRRQRERGHVLAAQLGLLRVQGHRGGSFGLGPLVDHRSRRRADGGGAGRAGRAADRPHVARSRMRCKAGGRSRCISVPGWARLATGSAVPLLGRLLAGIRPVGNPSRSHLAPRIGHRERRNENGRSPDVM
jgi:hypothetical protein